MELSIRTDRLNTRMDRWIIGGASVAVSGAILPFLFQSKDFNYVDGSPGYRMVLGLFFFLALCVALVHLREVLAVAARSTPLIAMMVLAFVSPLWAESSGLAFRRTLALFGTTLIGVLLAARFTSEQRLRLLGMLLRILLVASLLFSVVLPKYGISDDPLHLGDWVGVFGNKNELGAYASLSLLIDCFRPMRTRAKIFWFALYLILLIKSGSASPLAALLLTWAIVKVFQRMRERHRMSVKAIVITIVGGIGAVLAVGLGTGLFQLVLGRSADLTGRTGLWKALIPELLNRPLTGYGFGAFWAGGAREYFDLERQLGWKPMYAHNGYLEVMVSLGLIGLLLACWFLIQGVQYAVRRADTRQTAADLFPLSLMIFYLIRNVTECTILYPNRLEWSLWVATVLSVLPVRLILRSAPDQRAEVLPPVKEYA